MKSFKQFCKEVKEPTGELKKACWTGYTAVGTKKKNGKTVPNCVPEEVELSEEDTKVKHVHHNGEKIGETGVDSEASPGNGKWFAKHYKSKMDSVGFDSRKEAEAEVRAAHGIKEQACWSGYTAVGTKEKNGRTVPNCVPEEFMPESEAWERKEGKNPTGGLNSKGVASYNRANPGHHLQTAVTTKPSKLKPDSKAANRRKSFCARMSGMKKRLTSAKTANDPDSRINKSLRKWNC